MLRRLQQLSFFLLALFVVYLLVVRLLITWVQYAPNQFFSYIEKINDAQIQVERIDVEQNWLGLKFDIRQLRYRDADVTAALQEAKGDFNIFSPFIYDVSYGQKLQVTGLKLAFSDTAWDQPDVQPHSLQLDSLNIPFSKLWRAMTLKDIVFDFPVENDTSGQVAIENFQTYRGLKWSFGGVASLVSPQGDVSRLQMKGDFATDSWGRLAEGEMNTNLLTPLILESLYQVMPQAWSKKLPTGELLGDLNLQMRRGQLAKLNVTTSAQDLVWPQNDDLLPKSLGLALNWTAENQFKGGALENWRFEVERIRLGRRYVKSVSPIFVSLTDNKTLKFEAQELDFQVVKPLFNVLLANLNYEGFGDNLEALQLQNVQGQVDLEKIAFSSLTLQIPSLELPENENIPGLALKNLSIEKRGEDVWLKTDAPIEWTISMLHDKPIQMKLSDGFHFQFLAGFKGWSVPNANFTLDDMPVKVSAKGDFNGQVDGRVDIEPKQLSFVKAYLPYQLMTPDLEEWLKTALVSGDGATANLVVKGNLNDFPFRNGEGTFKATGTVHNAVLKFQPDWPAVEKFTAHLVFTPYDLRISADKAMLQNAEARNVVVDIKHLDTKNIAVQVSGEAQASAGDAKRFVLSSPLAEMVGIDGFLKDDLDITGRVSVSLPKIWIPVYGYAKKSETVDGEIQFHGVNATLFDRLKLKNVVGPLGFSEKGVTSKGLTAEFENGPAEIRVATHKKEAQITASGQAHYQTALYGGELPWQADVIIPFGEGMNPKVNTRFDLTTMQSHLPAPLSEAAMAENGYRPKVLEAQLAVQENQQLAISASMGSFMALKGLYSLEDDVLQRLSIAFNEQPLVLKQDGWRVNGQFGRLDVAGWQQAWPKIKQEWFSKDSAATDTKGEQVTETRWLPSAIRFKRVDVLDYHLKNVTAGWQSVAGSPYVELQIHNPNMDMVINQTSPNDYSVALDKLTLKVDAKKPEETRVEPPCPKEGVKPQENTKIIFRGKNIQINDRQLSRADFVLLDSASEMLINDIVVQPKQLKEPFRGSFRYDKSKNRSFLKASIKSKDAEDLIDFVGIRKGFKGNYAWFEANLQWPGSYACMSKTRLAGNLEFEFKDGVIKDAEPGIARVLGLLSFESLARRLKLNIQDVTDAGLAYDDIKGKATFKQGTVDLTELDLKAPAAKAQVSGQIDLVKSELDLSARITPAIGSTLPAIAAISGVATPLAGLAAYALMKLVPIVNEDLVTYRYEVTGTFENPKIKDKGLNLEPLNLDKPPENQNNSILDME
ncbi:hypothetical protein AVO42_10580 [Thiomicrospira sp. XS5]|uniref:YhdP family phospholipid transporter n=1 Tax=Thiomicrospira sp. XS5 TaxID=1775636 RepID=UPI0007494380|nr:DUF3971 domain-containing protein [Thiomicrospira sp. XS5]KUJ75722.1 hypothetical protein AVO42_10580 [Thiomicrospira sp. XS5]